MKDDVIHETWSRKCIAIVVGMEVELGWKGANSSRRSYGSHDDVPVAVDRTYYGV